MSEKNGFVLEQTLLEKRMLLLVADSPFGGYDGDALLPRIAKSCLRTSLSLSVKTLYIARHIALLHNTFPLPTLITFKLDGPGHYGFAQQKREKE